MFEKKSRRGRRRTDAAGGPLGQLGGPLQQPPSIILCQDLGSFTGPATVRETCARTIHFEESFASEWKACWERL